MRISDIPGDRAFDVLADCIDAFSSIAGDRDLMESIRDDAQGETSGKLRAMSKVLKVHKDDVYQILAAVAGTSVTEYQASHNAMQVLSDAFDVMTDDSITGFTNAVRPATGSHGDASVNTGGQGE